MHTSKSSVIKVCIVSISMLGALSAILINFATEWKTNPWAWAGVAVVSVATAWLTLQLTATSAENAIPSRFRQSQKSGSRSRNYQAGRDLTINPDISRSDSIEGPAAGER
jgi:uncharacterized membrane protein